MKTVQISRASRSLAEYARELDGIIVVKDANRAVAAVVPLDVADRESIALSAHPEFLKLIAQARDEFARGQSLSLEEAKAALVPNRGAVGKARAIRKRARSAR